MHKVIGDISKSKTTKTMISLTEFKGNKLINIREYFKNNTMAEWQPTKKGVMISTDKASELVTIFEQVEDAIKKGV